MKVLVTGADGFIGRNLRLRLTRTEGIEILPFDVSSEPGTLQRFLATADAIVHLAGINRPLEPSEYMTGNLGLTSDIANYLESSGRSTPIIFSSSIQAMLDNDYGKSKRAAEDRLMAYAETTGARKRKNREKLRRARKQLEKAIRSVKRECGS